MGVLWRGVAFQQLRGTSCPVSCSVSEQGMKIACQVKLLGATRHVPPEKVTRPEEGQALCQPLAVGRTHALLWTLLPRGQPHLAPSHPGCPRTSRNLQGTWWARVPGRGGWQGPLGSTGSPQPRTRQDVAFLGRSVQPRPGAQPLCVPDLASGSSLGLPPWVPPWGDLRRSCLCRHLYRVAVSGAGTVQGRDPGEDCPSPWAMHRKPRWPGRLHRSCGQRPRALPPSSLTSRPLLSGPSPRSPWGPSPLHTLRSGLEPGLLHHRELRGHPGTISDSQTGAGWPPGSWPPCFQLRCWAARWPRASAPRTWVSLDARGPAPVQEALTPPERAAGCRTHLCQA